MKVQLMSAQALERGVLIQLAFRGFATACEYWRFDRHIAWEEASRAAELFELAGLDLHATACRRHFLGLVAQELHLV